MKRFVFLVFITVFTASAFGAGSSRLVKLRILDRNKPQPAVKVLVAYPDGVHTCGTTITLNSDSEGFVQFALTQNVFWVTVPSLNQHVVGQQFDVPANAPADLRWDVRPREWRREVKK